MRRRAKGQLVETHISWVLLTGESKRCGWPAGRLLLATKRLMWDNFDDLIDEVPNERLVTLHRWTKESLGLHERS